MHKESAKKWALLEEIELGRLKLILRSMSGDEEDIRWIESNIHQISLSDSAVAAVVLENALELEESQILRKGGASIALDKERGIEANAHIDKIEETLSRKMLQSRLARLNGNQSLSNRLEEEAIRLSGQVNVLKWRYLLSLGDLMTDFQGGWINLSPIKFYRLSRKSDWRYPQ